MNFAVLLAGSLQGCRSHGYSDGESYRKPAERMDTFANRVDNRPESQGGRDAIDTVTGITSKTNIRSKSVSNAGQDNPS